MSEPREEAAGGGAHWESAEQVEKFASREPDRRVVEIIEATPDPGRTTVLDLGCAGGRNAELLARRGFDVYAVDASRAMVERTRKRLAGVLGRPEAERRVRIGRMEDLSEFPVAAFDLVVALGVLHQAGSRAEWDRALSGIARVLRPEGRLLVATFAPGSDPSGADLQPSEADPNLWVGGPAGPVFLTSADTLDAEMAPHGLRPEAPTATVRAGEPGRPRITVNALYRKESVRPANAASDVGVPPRDA